jgi:leucyl aminopeptidase
MQVALTAFTQFHNRYYDSDNGHKSAQWLFKQIGDLIEQSEAENDVSVRKFDHDWKQFSIIGNVRTATGHHALWPVKQTLIIQLNLVSTNSSL